MLVSTVELDQIMEKLYNEPSFSLDCESTGLNIHKGDRLFCVSIFSPSGGYVFNFKSYEGLESKYVLPLDTIEKIVLLMKGKTVYFANAKFDMHLLQNEVPFPLPDFSARDILIIDRCLFNQHLRYSLDEVAKRYGFAKTKVVEEYVKKHKVSYDKVPHQIMFNYALNDAEITYKIKREQMKKINFIEKNLKKGQPSFINLLSMEFKTTRVLFDIERTGVKINEEFIKRAIAHEQARIVQAVNTYREISGKDFVDSNKHHKHVFEAIGLSGGVSEKGNASFSAEALSKIKHPIARCVEEYRDASKKINSYYLNFLKFADCEGIVRPSIRQAVSTFRFSIQDPALQTLNKEEDTDNGGLASVLKVRDSFIARPGYTFLSVDYKQQEYRLAADYAGESNLIDRIMNGEDVHKASAELMGTTRTNAKTMNFLILYGGGAEKLAASLNIKTTEAKDLLTKYFQGLPKIKNFIYNTRAEAKAGPVYTWSGRILHFPLIKTKEGEEFTTYYKAPNHLIQSSGSDIMRKCLIALSDFLKPYKTRIVLTIHDEVLFELADDEHDLIPDIRQIMRDVYPPKNKCYMDTDFSTGQTFGSL